MVSMIQWICFLLAPLATPRDHTRWSIAEVILRFGVGITSLFLAVDVIIDADRTRLEVAVATTAIHFYTLDFILYTDTLFELSKSIVV